MFGKSKLRGPVGRIYPITIFSFYALGVIEFIIRKFAFKSGLETNMPVISIIGVAMFFIIMGIYQLIRYKHWAYPILGFFLGFGSLLSLFNIINLSSFSDELYFLNLFLAVAFIVFTWPMLYGQERYEANTRRLFKLAVDSLIETSAGFTSRPFSAGKVDVDGETIQGYARYLKSKYIAKPVYKTEGIYLLFSLGETVIKNIEPDAVSYVLFDKTGNISVHISAYDYKQYTERFTFDQLCNSFGNIFKRFLKYYDEGHESRIVSELKSV